MILDGSPIVITLKCNRKCIFCSRKKRDVIINLKKLKKIKKIPRIYKKITLTIEGGEPLLNLELYKIIEFFKDNGIDDIMLMTNGYLLNKERIKNLVKLGVNYFNINFPSHIEKLFNLLTGTKNQFNTTINNIRDLISITPNVVITEVINSLNYKYLPKYVIFINEYFKKISYLSINMIKVLGKVKKNKKLVPKFSDIRPYIISSFSIAKKYNIKILSDGIPLCFMKGFEDFSVSRLYPKLDTKEKIKILICKKCKKYKICDGIRKDYLEIYGNNEFQDNYY